MEQQHEQQHGRRSDSSETEQATGSEVPGEHLPDAERDLSRIRDLVSQGQGGQLRLG